MQLYIDYDNQRRVDGANAPLLATPQLAYMSAPVWSIAIRSGGAALNVSAATAWRAAVDSDFKRATDPMCRTIEGIDATAAATGVIRVPLETNTAPFSAAIDGKEKLAAWFELWGYAATGAQLYYLRIPISATNVLDALGGEPPAPATLWADKVYVDARLAVGYQVQFSSTPDVEASWVAAQGAHTHYRWRLRDGLAWSDPVALIPGKDGAQWHIAATVPDAALGVAGDCWLNTATGDLSRKTVSGWEAVGNLKGAAFEYSDFTPEQLATLKGSSAYQSWLAAGNVGTEADFAAAITAPRYQAFALPVDQINGLDVHRLDAVWHELALANNVRNAAAVWLWIRSASAITGNIVLTPSVNGVDQTAQTIAVTASDVRHRISFAAPATGKIKLRRDTAAVTDTLKDVDVVTAYVGTDIELEVTP